MEYPPARRTTSRQGGRHQLKRSLTESPLPVALPSNEISDSNHEQPITRPTNHTQTAHHKAWHYFRREKNYDVVLGSENLADLRHSIDMLRPGDATTLLTPAQSRRQSISRQPSTPRRQSVSVTRNSETTAANMETVNRQRQLAAVKLKTESLKQAVSELGKSSTATMERLDITYYSVLEKTKSLQNTIKALKELAESSQDTCATFDKESQSLEHEIVTQLAKFANLVDQQGQIQNLQERIAAGRGRMKDLSGRVELVRKRIERWDQADKEWQHKTRKRLTWLWTCMSIVVLVLFVVLLGIKYTTPDTMRSVAEGITKGVTNSRGSLPFVEPFTDAIANMTGELLPSKGNEDNGNTRLNWKRPVIDEERLRALDEL